MNTLARGTTLETAVRASRMHFEEGVLQIEGGHDPALASAMDAVGYAVNAWPDQHMYFGGVHAVALGSGGEFTAVGDPRRGGSAIVVCATADC